MDNDLWDAQTYDKVSSIQEGWALDVMQRRNKWRGDEVVLDAGCGSGRPTRALAGKVPEGRVYAVDMDPNMVRQAQANLRDCNNVQVIQSDITRVKLPAKVDVVFSNAVLHWIADHRAVFANFAELLKDRGQLLAQCGGQGNLESAIAILDRVASSDPFRRYFAGWKNPWNFATPDDTEKLLYEAGFRNATAKLSAAPVTFASREQFSTFVKTAVVRSHLARLPAVHQDRFLEAYLDECERQSQQKKWLLGYVRLNITAEK
ncbi:MAG TPA: methyltransferase domain-containing protein [Nitrososphaera sp.]|nr:methyltransferase domain-containing protein [Nitrososphaera sp.]